MSLQSSIECFVPSVPELDPASAVVVSGGDRSFSRVTALPREAFRSSGGLRHIAETAKEEYLLLYMKDVPAELGYSALDRILSIAGDSGADMLYSDYMEKISGTDGNTVVRKHPLIDCQEGALRDDFDFGPVMVFRTSSFREAARRLPDGLLFGGLYALRLMMKSIFHINEFLYT